MQIITYMANGDFSEFELQVGIISKTHFNGAERKWLRAFIQCLSNISNDSFWAIHLRTFSLKIEK